MPWKRSSTYRLATDSSDDFALRVYKKKRNVKCLPDDWNHLQEFQLIEVVIKSGCAFLTRITTSEDLN